MKVRFCKPPDDYEARKSIPKSCWPDKRKPGAVPPEDVYIRSTKDLFIDNKASTVYKFFSNTETNLIRFWNEITCLKLLQNNFINKQNIPYFPFPKLLDYNEHKLLIKTTYCGIQARINTDIKPIFLQQSVECIIDNLKHNFIMYKDIHPNNICIDTRGYVYLIDFDVAFLFYYKNYNPPVGSHRYTKEKFDNFYNKPKNLDIYKDFDISILPPWKSKPWSILYMFKENVI
jgi:hypothetical protein